MSNVILNKEYVEVLRGSLYGFMEGNFKSIEGHIMNRFKSEFGITPEFVEINVLSPYKNLDDLSSVDKEYYGKDTTNMKKCVQPVIVLSARINGLAYSIVRDCQFESDYVYLENKSRGITYDQSIWEEDVDFSKIL